MKIHCSGSLGVNFNFHAEMEVCIQVYQIEQNKETIISALIGKFRDKVTDYGLDFKQTESFEVYYHNENNEEVLIFKKVKQ